MSYRSRCTDHLSIIFILGLTMMYFETCAFGNNMYYVPNEEHNGIYIIDEQLSNFETESKLMCLMLCNENEQCQSFSYNSLSMRCQHFLMTFWDIQNVTGTIEDGWRHYDPFKVLDCKELHEKQFITGIYIFSPANYRSYKAKCEMDFDGGGWTLIQERFDGTVDFQRTWLEYKTGFGNLKGEFWLGNDLIHSITTSVANELRVDICDWYGNSWYAVYKTFSVGDENSQYRLTIGNYIGTAGDDMSYHNGMKFSTLDRDNDRRGNDKDSCTFGFGGNGGWWYNNCDRANLNSLYGKDINSRKGMEWDSALVDPSTLKITRMMIRRL